MNNCKKCGSPILEATAFCGHCGASLLSTGFTNYTRVRELFDQAQQVAPDQLDRWLNEVCRGDQRLLSELQAMLHEQERDTFTKRTTTTGRSSASKHGPSTQQMVGKYRLLRELGRGGMGVVYLAERDDGTFRKNVALKLLLSDAVTDDFIPRFKQERQVLAALDHPNIARILDGGDTAGGMPYYVMEYVEGLPLDQYCDHQQLSLSGRVKVFQEVCRAVHYLHQNSVVHRDLKPSNIMVTTDGVVKLLDFGIAKVVGAGSFSSSDLTNVQGRPMTPSYASPEQFQSVTTLQRTSDVYSLGIILYRLLTGRAPWKDLEDKEEKLAAREDPPLPSNNIREDLRSKPESTTRLKRAMMGELDSIVLMAMKYNPKERYQSAADFASDLQLFLEGQSVTAHHDSIAGRSMKMLRRKRALLAVLAAFLALASFGIWQWQQAEFQKREVVAAQARLRSVMDQLERQPELKAVVAAGDAAAKTVAARTADIRRLTKAFAADFTVGPANKIAVSPERDALLTRGVKYLDKMRASSPSNLELGLALADAYQQLALLQETTASASNERTAVATYQKAADVLGTVSSTYPDSTVARELLQRINRRLASFKGYRAPSQVPAVPIVDKAAIPVTDAAAKRLTNARENPVQLNTPPQPPKPVVRSGPALSAAENAELEDRVNNVMARIETADQTIDPIRKNLEQTGQTLNPDTMNAIHSMHSSLSRAQRDMEAGNAAGAREDLTVAEAFANRVLKYVGR